MSEESISLIQKLPQREKLILKHFCEGHPTFAIARSLGIPTGEVGLAIRDLYRAIQLNKLQNRLKRPRAVAMYRQYAEAHPAEAAEIARLSVRIISDRSSAPPANGHDTRIPSAQRSGQSPAVSQTPTDHGAGVSVPIHEPEKVLDVAALTLGVVGSDVRMQVLLRSGYVPEIINDYQSLANPAQAVTRLIFVKRKS